MRGEAHRAALDTVEQAIGQDDAGAGDLGEAMELDVERVHLVLLERHHVAAVDVPAAREGTQLAQEALGAGPLPGHHLHPDLASPPHLRRSRHEGDEALVRFGDEEHPALNAREDAAVIEGDVDVLDRALLGWLSAEHTAGVGHQVRERHAHVFVRDVDADHGGRATGRGEVRVERHLDVGVVGDGERLGDDRQLRRFDAEVCA